MIRNKSATMHVLGALGIVFGDIGTSPLYAMRETLAGLNTSLTDVLGILSLIFWTLILVISVKYLVLVFRADNEGEGGVFALLALLRQKKTRLEPLFYFISIFGGGLLVGDGMLTPAISVTSALEGLDLILPGSQNEIIVLSISILCILFWAQSKGTGSIGNLFGPIILVWFITIAGLGLNQIIANPVVLKAINPYYAINFFHANAAKSYFLLGGIFLVVTGGEALYADIGHFGKSPIRWSWFMIVLPCLVLNYFGQGANLLNHPENITNPFYKICPEWFTIPLLLLATMATVIASQAVISATFSMIKQAVLLGLYPRLTIIQTSKKYSGQIYVPQINFFLFIGTISLILLFKNSSHLTHAYGIAVNGLMLMVTIMVAYAAHTVWNWSIFSTILVFSGFIALDSLFLGANFAKFHTGGWVPVSFALFIAIVMHTWNQGLRYLKKNFFLHPKELKHIIQELSAQKTTSWSGGLAICVADVYDKRGGSFLHFLKLSKVVPEHILIINYMIENRPHVPLIQRFEIEILENKVFYLNLHYGFMDDISIPHALKEVHERHLLPFPFEFEKATFLVEVPNITASKKKRTMRFFWQEKLFAFLIRNYTLNINIEFYHLPYDRTIAIGSYCLI